MLLLFEFDHLQMFSFCGRDCHQYRSYRYMTYTVLAGRKTLPDAILALTISQAFISSHLFSIPWHNLSFGARAFCVSAPKIWNSSPSSNPKQTVLSFRRHLKTHYFHSAYLSPCGPHNAPDSLLRLWRYINSLLTCLPYLLNQLPSSCHLPRSVHSPTDSPHPACITSQSVTTFALTTYHSLGLSVHTETHKFFPP